MDSAATCRKGLELLSVSLAKSGVLKVPEVDEYDSGIMVWAWFSVGDNFDSASTSELRTLPDRRGLCRAWLLVDLRRLGGGTGAGSEAIVDVCGIGIS